MLTLLETIAAIKTLDTEPDVIKNACEQILYGELKQRISPTSKANAIAQDMTLAYSRIIEDKGELLMAFLMAAGFTASLLCKPGHEVKLIGNCSDQLRQTFVECRSKYMAQLYHQDPDKAAEMLITLLTQSDKKHAEVDIE